jgi:hypothetical protein
MRQRDGMLVIVAESYAVEAHEWCHRILSATGREQSEELCRMVDRALAVARMQ